jgi:hypothetical protein
VKLGIAFMPSFRTSFPFPGYEVPPRPAVCSLPRRMVLGDEKIAEPAGAGAHIGFLRRGSTEGFVVVHVSRREQHSCGTSVKTRQFIPPPRHRRP